MKNLKFKVMGIIIMLTVIISVMPSFVRAAQTDLEAVILEKTSGDKIIYIKDMNSIDFKYAFSDNENEENPEYKSCLQESNGENVALLENGKTYKYMFIAVEGKNSVVDLSTLKKITEEEINKIESLTKRIPVDTTGSVSFSSKKEDGTAVTTTQGKITIKDEKDFLYKYQLIEILDKNNTITIPNTTAVELYEQLTNFEKATKMYDKMLIQITIRDDYQSLIENAKWEEAKNMEIMQPRDSQKGEKYIVIIQKISNENVVNEDVQFMTCDREDDEDVEYTNTVVTKTIEKKIALPVTGEAIALYIALGVILFAIVGVGIRMKYVKGKINDKN